MKRNFLAEYVIYPIAGENEQIASASGGEHGPALVGEASADTAEDALNP